MNWEVCTPERISSHATVNHLLTDWYRSTVVVIPALGEQIINGFYHNPFPSSAFKTTAPGTPNSPRLPYRWAARRLQSSYNWRCQPSLLMPAEAVLFASSRTPSLPFNTLGSRLQRVNAVRRRFTDAGYSDIPRCLFIAHKVAEVAERTSVIFSYT